jgi:hypothetical protein
MKRTIAFLIAIVACLAFAASCASVAPFEPLSVIAEGAEGEVAFRLLGREEAAAFARTEDEWVRSLSRFDRAALLGREAGLGNEDCLEKLAAETAEWTSAEAKSVCASLEELARGIRPLGLRLPREIAVVKTTGREQDGAAYTRMHGIMVSQAMLRLRGRQLTSLLAHELFHVYSRYNPSLRSALYGIVGFKPGPAFEWPEGLEERRITNPDAFDDWYAEIDLEGRTVTVYPALYADRPFEPGSAGGLFSYLHFALIEVSIADGKARPALVGGIMAERDPFKTKPYLALFGGNTDYVIHPEEGLAEMFAMLVLGGKAKEPSMLEELRSAIATR